MFISDDRDFPLTKTLPRVLLPLLWVDEVYFTIFECWSNMFICSFILQGVELNEEMVGIVKDSLSALDLVPIVVWTLFGIGLALIIGFAAALYFTRNRSSSNLV